MFTVNVGNMRGFKPDISQCAGGKDGCVKGAGLIRCQVIKKHDKTGVMAYNHNRPAVPSIIEYRR